MRRWGEARWRGTALALAAVAVATTIPALNHGPARINTASGVDASIPLVPIFVLPYLSLFVFVPWSAYRYLARHPATFTTAAGSLLLALLASGLVYAVAQSYIAPPTLRVDGIFAGVLRLVYAADGRYNAFPSLHVGLSTVLAIEWWRSGDRIRAVMVIWAALIIASTVLIKQHFIADVIAGLTIGLAATAVSARLWAVHGSLHRKETGHATSQAVAVSGVP